MLVAVAVGVIGLIAVALNFYAAAQAERRHLHSSTPNPHWQSEAAVDLVAGVVVAVAAVVVIASLLH
ncbi:MAG: hypothetical protein ACREMY_07290 [bacterium]